MPRLPEAGLAVAALGVATDGVVAANPAAPFRALAGRRTFQGGPSIRGPCERVGFFLLTKNS